MKPEVEWFVEVEMAKETVYGRLLTCQRPAANPGQLQGSTELLSGKLMMIQFTQVER